MPAYTSDAAADYSVLEKLRNEWATPDWDGPRFWLFEKELRRILEERAAYYEDGEKPERTGWVEWYAQYEPGDYSRAALAVLKDKQVS
jgi:hypothetical protein